MEKRFENRLGKETDYENINACKLENRIYG